MSQIPLIVQSKLDKISNISDFIQDDLTQLDSETSDIMVLVNNLIAENKNLKLEIAQLSQRLKNKIKFKKSNVKIIQKTNE